MSLRLVPYDDSRHASRLGEVTRILHEAYAPLARDGMRYLASHQDEEVTRERLCGGQSWLLFVGDELAGTVSLYEGARKPETAEYYRRPGVWYFGQFALRPVFQGAGNGSRVMEFLEGEARRQGAAELALDTSRHAARLIALYRKRGYEVVAGVRWPDVNYRSVILSKKLG